MPALWRVMSEHLPSAQQRVEADLRISLGKLHIYPLVLYGLIERPSAFYPEGYFAGQSRLETLFESTKDWTDDIVSYAEDGIHAAISDLGDHAVGAKAGAKGVYWYGPPNRTNDLSTEVGVQLLLHELYHIALARYSGHRFFSPELVDNLPMVLDEGFAEYMARRAMPNLGFVPKRLGNNDEARWFEHEVRRRHLTRPAAIADLALDTATWGDDADIAFLKYLKKH
ncbi:TPA: hypothetical protein HA251_02665 [Candidatus Woesearchaeota archaeon]|nr:hypothetical protein [Candidatus Woesearchaeota archaeon]